MCYHYTITVTIRLYNLTWHNNAIPGDEIWVKFGGDKGGNSFKFIFQIVNILHPHNTCVVLAFQAGDSYINLKVALELYRSQITVLQTTQWRYSIILYAAFSYLEITNS